MASTIGCRCRQASRRSYLAPFVALLCVLVIIRPCQASYSFELFDEEICYTIRAPNEGPSILSGGYDLLDEDVDGSILKVFLLEEKTTTVKWRSSEVEASEGNFHLQVEPGRYSLCFIKEEDADEEIESIDVGFAFRRSPMPRTLDPDEEGPDALRAISLFNSAETIREDWVNLLDHYDFLRNRERVHRDLMEQIFGRLVRWTFIEALLVSLMAFGQVMYWRKFFEQRRYL